MVDALKDCPFCGCRAEVLEEGDKFYIVFCRECRSQTLSYLTIEQAEKAWNRRVKVDEDNETIEKLIKIKDKAYSERDKCIAALANFIRDIAHPNFRVYTAYHEGDEWEDDWRNILVIERGDLQMTWHFHDSEKYLFDRLPVNNIHKWDGHDTKEKYNRLLKCFVGVRG